MTISLNGSGGITYPDGSVNTTRAASTAGDTFSGQVAINLPTAAPGLKTASPSFAGVSMRATGTGGREYYVASTDDANGQGGGLLSIYDQTALQARLNIDSRGYVTTPTIPSFYARYASQKTKAAGWSAPPVFDYTDYNVGSHWNGTTFTAPVAGLYQFVAGGFYATATPSADVRVGISLRRNGIDVQIGGGQLCTSDSPFPLNTFMARASANDSFSLYVYSTIDIVNGAGANYSFIFAGHLLG